MRNGYNHHPFDKEGLGQYLRTTDKETIMTEFNSRSTLQNPEQFCDWSKNPLDRDQLLYLYLEAVTPFRLLIQFALRLSDLLELVGQIDRMSIDVTIAEVLDLALCWDNVSWEMWHAGIT